MPNVAVESATTIENVAIAMHCHLRPRHSTFPQPRRTHNAYQISAKSSNARRSYRDLNVSTVRHLGFDRKCILTTGGTRGLIMHKTIKMSTQSANMLWVIDDIAVFPVRFSGSPIPTHHRCGRFTFWHPVKLGKGTSDMSVSINNFRPNSGNHSMGGHCAVWQQFGKSIQKQISTTPKKKAFDMHRALQ